MSEQRLRSVIVFLVRDNRVLLGKKQTGHGPGMWNGAGGRALAGESSEDAARRETRAELGVTPMSLREVAVLEFNQTPYVDEYSETDITVYLCDEWQGEPSATDALATPTWFAFDDMPYEEMWSADRYWLPQALSGERVIGRFTFDGDFNLIEHSLTPDSAVPPTLNLEERVAEALHTEPTSTGRIDG